MIYLYLGDFMKKNGQLIIRLGIYKNILKKYCVENETTMNAQIVELVKKFLENKYSVVDDKKN